MELERLALSGNVVSEQPGWVRLQPSPAYFVLGDWLCMPLRAGEKDRIWDATTAVTRDDMSWWDAFQAGLVPDLPRWVRIWPASETMQRRIDEVLARRAVEEVRRSAESAAARQRAAAQAARAAEEAAERQREELRPYGWAAVVLSSLGMSVAVAPIAPLIVDDKPASEIATAAGYGFWAAVAAAGLVLVFERAAIKILWSVAVFALTFTEAIIAGALIKTTGSEDYIGLMLLSGVSGLIGTIAVRTGQPILTRCAVAVAGLVLLIATAVALA
jgi:hypothetical protein